MNKLIKVTTNERDEQLVNGRDLWAFLTIKTKFADWIKNSIRDFDFIEGQDFELFSKFLETGGRTKEYVLKIDMAKELSMLARNDKGKEARKYFIEVEKAWNLPELVMARALQFANQKILTYQDNITQLEKTVEKQKPKVLFANSVASSKTSILIGELAKLIKQNGHDIGQNRLFEWLRGNGYLIRRKGTDRNMPTQRSMDLGLFEIKERVINNPDGTTFVTKTPKVKGKGQIYFVNKFLAEKEEEK